MSGVCFELFVAIRVSDPFQGTLWPSAMPTVIGSESPICTVVNFISARIHSFMALNDLDSSIVYILSEPRDMPPS